MHIVSLLVFWSQGEPGCMSEYDCVVRGSECFNDGLSLNSRGSWPDIQHSVSCIYSVIPCMLSWKPWNLWPIKQGFVLYRCFFLFTTWRSFGLYFLQGLLSHLVDVDLSSRPHKTRCVLLSNCPHFHIQVIGFLDLIFNVICHFVFLASRLP